MRRGSVIGPLILIGLGVLFLFRNLWPEIPLVDLISRFWPFLLIAWGGIRLIEILFWSMTGKPLPRNGVSGGEWALIFVICIVGATMYTAHNARSWFPTGEHVETSGGAHGRNHTTIRSRRWKNLARRIAASSLKTFAATPRSRAART